MAEVAANATEQEVAAAADYFAAIPARAHLQVVKADRITGSRAKAFLLRAIPGAGEPLGDRIVEGPADFERFERRDPRLIYTAYVLPRSLKRGEALARGGGARVACDTCHGAGLRGGAGAAGPPLAGRSPSYPLPSALRVFHQRARRRGVNPHAGGRRPPDPKGHDRPRRLRRVPEAVIGSDPQTRKRCKDGIGAVLEKARLATKGRNVKIGGGVETVRQYLCAGLIDELHFALSAVVLGRGEAMFAGIDLPALGYRVTEHQATEFATHIVLSRSVDKGSPKKIAVAMSISLNAARRSDAGPQ